MKEIIIDKKAENRHGEYELEEKEIERVFENEYKQISAIFDEVYKNQVNGDNEKEKIKSLNNIIGIIGERGAGKSSFMKSFSQIQSESKEVLSLETIDPSKFTNRCNILEIVLGNMFKKFKGEIEEKNSENRYSDKRELLESFQNVYKSVKYLKNKNGDITSEVDELLVISDSFNLKENLEELIDNYLRFFNKKCLLICIDDIDLNTKYAYDMLEDIRKYLMTKSVIILLAAKMEQLFDVIKNNYLLEFDKMKNELLREIDDRSNRYLLKLLPYDRRVYLSNPFEDRFYSVISKNKDGNEIKIIFKEKDSNEETNEEEISLSKYLNECCGDIFLVENQVKEKYKKSLLFPNNLRELIFFILKIENIGENSEKKIKLQQFKTFFRQYWVEEKLSSVDRRIINEFCELDTDEEKNDYIYGELLKKLELDEKERKEEKEKVGKNISLGDVRNLINRLREKFEEKKFIFALETVYSIYFGQGRFLNDNNYILDAEVDRFGKTVNSYNFDKLKQAISKIENENEDKDKNEDEKYKQLIGLMEEIISKNENNSNGENGNENNKEIEKYKELIELMKEIISKNENNSNGENENENNEELEKHKKIIELMKEIISKNENNSNAENENNEDFEKYKKIIELMEKIISKNELKKYKEIIRFMEDFVLPNEYNSDIKKGKISIDLNNDERNQKDINFSKILFKIIDKSNINSEILTQLENEMRKKTGKIEKFYKKIFLFYRILLKQKYGEIKKFCKKENRIKLINRTKKNLETIFEEKIEKNFFKKILGTIREIELKGKDKGILLKEYEEYVDRLVDESFKKNTFIYRNLFSGILFLIDNDKKENNRSALNYFLRGSFDTELNKEKIFLGVMGGYHIYSYLCSEEEKIMIELERLLEAGELSFLQDEDRRALQEMIANYKEKKQLEDMSEKMQYKIISNIIENLKTKINEGKNNQKNIIEKNVELIENTKLTSNQINRISNIRNISQNKKNLFKIIIDRLDENGSIKELFHLNECNPDEVFYENEVKEIDKISEEIWIKRVVDING